MPNVKEWLISEANQPLILTPNRFSALMKADLAKYGKIIKTADIKVD